MRAKEATVTVKAHRDSMVTNGRTDERMKVVGLHYEVKCGDRGSLRTLRSRGGG